MKFAQVTVGLILALGTMVAQAIPMAFTDQATWAASAGSTTLIDFESFAAGTLISNQLPGIAAGRTIKDPSPA